MCTLIGICPFVTSLLPKISSERYVSDRLVSDDELLLFARSPYLSLFHWHVAVYTRESLGPRPSQMWEQGYTCMEKMLTHMETVLTTAHVYAG